MCRAAFTLKNSKADDDIANKHFEQRKKWD